MQVLQGPPAWSHGEQSSQSSPCCPADLHFFDGGPRTLQYLLAVDTVNFCFWPGPPGLEYEHLARGLKVPSFFLVVSHCCVQTLQDEHIPRADTGETLESMCMPAEQDALGREPGALDAGELARMTGPRLQALLSLPAPLPAQEERAALLREVRTLCTLCMP